MNGPLPSAATPPAWVPRWVGVSLLVIALVFLLEHAKPLLLPIVVAVILTFLLAGPVRRLRRAGLPEPIGAGVVVLSLLMVLALLGSTLAAPAAEWWEEAPRTVRQLLESIDRVRAAVIPDAAPVAPALPRPPPRRRSSAAAAAAPPASAASAAAPPDPLAEKLATEGVNLGRIVLAQAVTFGVSAAATVILLYFLLASEHWLLSRTVEAVRRRRTRALVLGGLRQAQREIALFLGTMLVINLGVGGATAAALWALGLPNPALWGTATAILNFVPYLGPLIITALLTLAATMAFGATAAVFGPPLAFLAIHAVESNFVTPWVVGRRLRLSPVSVFVSVMVWGWLWGIAGALIAVPLLLALRTVCKRTRRLALVCNYLEGDWTEPPSLRSLLRTKRRRRGAAL